MPAMTTPVCDFDWPAPDFELIATDGRLHSRDQIAGTNGLLVMFICNHCPFVLAVLDKMIRDGAALQEHGIGVAAICSNDARSHPADSFPEMVKMAEAKSFPFPYLHDEDQSIARAYGATCTPDFFGFNAKLGLQYRGRLDASRASAAPDDLPRELYEAMIEVAKSGRGPAEQTPSIGCSIKWKAA